MRLRAVHAVTVPGPVRVLCTECGSGFALGACDPRLRHDAHVCPACGMGGELLLDLDFPDQETTDAMRRALVGPEEHETMQPCPACIACDACSGLGMVTREQAARFRAGAR